MSDEELEKGLDEIFKEDTQAIRESMKSLMRSYDNALGELVKKDKVIDLMAIELFNYANLNILGICEAELENGNYDMNLCKMSLANRNCCECIKKHFYKKVEEEK